MRVFPVVTHILYLTLLILILPFYIAVKRPDFIILEPRFGCSVLALESRLFLRGLRPKIILDIRSTPVEVHTFRRSLAALAFSSSIVVASKTFDGITLATNQMRLEICQQFQLNPKLTRVWHNGVDIDLFRPQKSEGKQMRKKFGLSNKFVVFYHGSFRPHGGIVESIKSIEILKNDYPNIVLFLLGAGTPATLELIETMRRNEEITDRVIIHDPVDYSEVPRYIAMADVCIVPLPNIADWRYQNPLKLIEYLAMKKAVIATDIPANRALIGEEKCGLYLSSTSPEEIAKTILYAYANREILEKWGASGRLLVKEEYDWKAVARSFEKNLQEFA
jgi:glycosyltransferase involved in cell wall biosynthesis